MMQFPLLARRPAVTPATTRRVHTTRTTMRLDKNPINKGVELRTIQLIVNAAEGLIRQCDEVESIEIYVRYIDRAEHPNLVMDIGKILHESQHDLKRRLADTSIHVQQLHVFEFDNGTITADIELERIHPSVT